MTYYSHQPEQNRYNYFAAPQMQQERAQPIYTAQQVTDFSGQPGQPIYGVVGSPSNIPIVAQEYWQANGIAGITPTPTWPFSKPEVTYSMPLRGRNKRTSNLEQTGIQNQLLASTREELITALHQIYSEQQLSYNGIYFKDNSNALNPSFYQDSILSPLLWQNRQIPSEIIQSSKVVVAGSLLMKFIQKFGRSVTIWNIVSLAIMFAGYTASLILQNTVNQTNNIIIVPYAIFFAILAVLQILLFISLRKFKLNYLNVIQKLSFACLLYSLVILSVGLTVSMPDHMQYIWIHVIISVYMIIISLVGLFRVNLVCDSMRRIAVLFKQIPEQEILLQNACC